MPTHSSHLRGLLEHWGKACGVLLSISCFSNPLVLLSELEDYKGYYDLFFLDVGLGEDIDGFALAGEIRRYHLLAPLIFVTQSTSKAATTNKAVPTMPIIRAATPPLLATL